MAKKVKQVKQTHFKDRKTGEAVMLNVAEKVVTTTKNGRKRYYLKAYRDGCKFSRQVKPEIFNKINAPVVISD